MAYEQELAGLRGYQLPAPTKVSVKLPKYTTTERNALTMTASDDGSIVFDTDLKKAYCWDGTAWNALW